MISVETIYNKVCEEQDVVGPQLSIKLTTSVTASTKDLHIGATTLSDVFAFMQEYKAKSGDLDMLYEKNVRKFLGNKRKVNKGIEKTSRRILRGSDSITMASPSLPNSSRQAASAS